MFLDEQIANLSRRIKNIEANPRPDLMKSNKLRYEIELDSMLHAAEAWKAGKPFAILGGVEILNLPLGFEQQGYVEWGDRARAPERYMNIAVNKFGWSEHTCDRTLAALGLLLSGEVPMPRVMSSRRMPCEPERWSLMAAAKYAGILFFEVDRLNSIGEQNLRTVADHMAELIEFCEKSVPGIKFDESRLVELLEMDDQATKYLRATYDLRKKEPCPIGPQDAFRLIRMPSRHHDPPKVLEYCKMFSEEMLERSDKNMSGVKEENLRIAWLATGPFGRGTFDLLAKKGVSLPWFHYGLGPQTFGVMHDDYGEDKIYGRKLKPLEEVVRTWHANVWGADAATWVDPLVTVCRDLKIDAVVDFMQVGCRTTNSMRWITAKRLKDELGIPTLDLEGRELYATESAQQEMNRKLEEFLDMCIANKKAGKAKVK